MPLPFPFRSLQCSLAEQFMLVLLEPRRRPLSGMECAIFG
jgi:hypothetical protein